MLRSVTYLFILNLGGWHVLCPLCDDYHPYQGEKWLYCPDKKHPFECVEPKLKAPNFPKRDGRG